MYDCVAIVTYLFVFFITILDLYDSVMLFTLRKSIPKDLEKDLGVCDDDHLRNILKVSKSNFRGKLTISLESPSRNFSAWTFNDVCAEYNLPESTDPSLSVIPQFAEIEAAILDSDLHKEALDQLIKEVDFRTHALQLTGANDATKSIIMASFLVAATRLFEEDLFLGRRGNGPVDFSVHSRKTMDSLSGQNPEGSPGMCP
ncbi:hypothetical protein BC939DRAFT_447862 [Gamsiella multidivaricata]|uniref:uncharacterized protein n=1 Tax=Gamsiella multidivaricata TaxID=101098 RepID=UPI00221E8749|nr:uncharacterized protein BC939DRAFT_447862 [Gamsiella multidivaricata]KAI7825616.1 hypothetical protein BC939DRAFT_447862 [Gamsiella multidivaricata]